GGAAAPERVPRTSRLRRRLPSSEPRTSGLRTEHLLHRGQPRTMSEPFVAGVGAVLSADIAVPQLGRELRFYSRILSTGAEPFWREDLMNNRGYPIIGM